MSQIEELQRRIMAAMERIGSGVEALDKPISPSGDYDQDLKSALEEERLANAQLEERLKALKDRHDQETDAMRADIEKLRGQSNLDGENAQLRAQLEEATSKLATVEAAREDLAEAKAALENTTKIEELTAEIESLRSLKGAAEEAAALRKELEELTPLADRAEELQAEVKALRASTADTERLGDLNAELAMLRAERTSHGAAMSRLDDDLQRLRKANEELRGTVEELRSAAQQGVTDAALLNRATAAELEATRAARASDAAEAHAVLARLEPLLNQANLAEGEVE
ncbi:hypothetical protein [Ruegeria arenilitoris]|uniref:hypothetical protein n=1 Tax=Ruegeria arenilitoris TaxID=1173585 RepID=UPI00147B02DE|nr:hypothetical protein [Ruegeria arenilitoris]